MTNQQHMNEALPIIKAASAVVQDMDTAEALARRKSDGWPPQFITVTLESTGISAMKNAVDLCRRQASTICENETRIAGLQERLDRLESEKLQGSLFH